MRRTSVQRSREAFEAGDAQEARRLHTAQAEPIYEQGHVSHCVDGLWQSVDVAAVHGCAGSAITMALVCAATVAQLSLSMTTYLGLCLSVVFPIAFTVLNALHKRENRSLESYERRRETWECDNYLEGEQREMVELYHAKGLSKEDARAVVSILSGNTSLFVDIMMVEELGILPSKPLRVELFSLFLSGFASLIGSIVPLASMYCLTTASSPSLDSHPFTIASCAFVLCFAVFGSIHAIVHVNSWWASSSKFVSIALLVLAIVYWICPLLWSLSSLYLPLVMTSV